MAPARLPLETVVWMDAAELVAPGRAELGAPAGRLSDNTLRLLTFRSRCLLGT